MARRVREHDWSRTPLGPMDRWPQSLRTAVSICLGSRFPMMLWWGPQLINIHNDAFIPVLGEWHPRALGMSGREVWTETWPVIGPQVAKVMDEGGSTLNERVRLVYTRHGFPEETWFSWSFGPIRDESGGVGGLFNTCHEDTQHVLAERERDRLAAQRQLALDAARLGWWHYDPATKVATFDQRYREIFAVTGNRRPNDELLKRLHPDDVPRVWTKVEAALDPADPKPYSAEYRIVLDDGSVRWVEAHGMPAFEGEGKDRRATSFVGTVADITDRRQAGEELRAQSALTEAVASNAAEALYLLDAEGLVTYANPAAEAMFGWTGKQMLGRKLHDLIHYKHPDGTAFPIEDCTVGRCFASGRTLKNHEDVFVHRDGSFVPVLCSLAPVQRDSRIAAAVLAVIDITERKRVEEERTRLVNELETQRARLADVFQRSPSFMAVVRGPDHVFELCNERYDELVGHRDLIGKPVREALPEVQGQAFLDLLDRAYTTGEPFVGKDMVVTLRRQPGQPPEERSVEFVYQPLREADGKVSGIFVHGVDLTERKLAEAALRESEGRLSAILSNMPAMVYVVDKENRFRFINRRWESVFGLNVSDASGRSIYDFFPRDVADQFAANNRAVLDSGKPHESEEIVPQGDGDHTYISVKVPLFDPDGHAFAICGISTDITDRKRAEEALRRSEAAFRELADAMPQIVFAAGPDGDVDYFNRQWYEYTGLPEGSTGFESWRHVHTEEGLRRVMEAWPDALRTGRPYEIEYRLRRRDGAYRWHLGRALPIRDSEGRIIRWFGTNTDIHDYKQLQEQNERLLESERAARVEAERASESKSEFLATLSHELRTPLTPVLLTVSLMERHAGLPDELRNDLAAIRRNVELESRLIGDLLDLTRISKGKLQLDLQEVDLHVVLRSAIDICQREASAKLEVDLRAKRHTVRGDNTRLQQIFWNLINNAQKFTPPTGTITVRSCDAPDGRVRVETADTGAGIDPAVMPRLFSAFEQGEVRSARQQAGLGLGLAISKQLAEAHGGSISARSEGRGRGATFTVELPVSESLAAEAPAAARPGATRPATQPMTILLVEDHEPTLRILSRLLTQLGHRVTGVTSVASATTAARRETFDLIISDLGLPDGSGLDVMRQLRDQFTGRGIALTGYGMESDLAASREAGFVEHLTKPVDLAALEAAIERVRVAGG